MCDNYRIQIENSAARMRTRLQSRINEGVIITALKYCASLHFATWGRIFFRLLVPQMHCLARRYAAIVFPHTAVTDEDHFVVALDLYKIFMDGLLLICYACAWKLSRSNTSLSQVLDVICILFAFGRLTEQLALATVLLVDKQHITKSSIRAVANTLWLYCSIALSFAIFYTSLLSWDPTAIHFGAVGHDPSFVDPLYFSAVTITTLGYGDFTPNSRLSKLLVLSQLAAGSFVLLIILQRAITARDKASQK